MGAGVVSIGKFVQQSVNHYSSLCCCRLQSAELDQVLRWDRCLTATPDGVYVVDAYLSVVVQYPPADEAQFLRSRKLSQDVAKPTVPERAV